MEELPFRTKSTWLSDRQLVLLDVLFDRGALESFLTRDVFCRHYNLRYSHEFTDEQLQQQISELSKQNVITRVVSERGPAIRITPHGGELWSQERTPIWDRFCWDRYTTTLQGRTLMSVVAVSPDVRDNFLELWPMDPARRRRVIIRDYGLIEWHPFEKLYVGLATYFEPNRWSGEEAVNYAKLWREHWERLGRQRTWWRCVPELQRFVPRTA